MSRPYSPLAIANAFIETAGPSGVDHMSVQKLTYLASGWWLGFKRDALCNSLPEIWRYGPVYPDLHTCLRHFGMRPIRKAQSNHFLTPAPRLNPSDKDAWDMIHWIQQRYGSFTAEELSTVAHAKGTPWHIEADRADYRVTHGTVIPEQTLRDYFSKEVRLMTPRQLTAQTESITV
jgi:uncharacterized phage-associated protein